MDSNKTQAGKRAGRLLFHEFNTLTPLVRHARELAALDEALAALLAGDLKDHFRVANIAGDALVVQASSSVWAARLRFLAPRILQGLTQTPAWSGLRRVRVRVSPHELPDPVPAPQPRALSTANARLLRRTAEDIDHRPLREALLRLSRHGRRA